MKKIIITIILLLIPFIFAFILPVPKGLSYAAWVLFAIYIAAILGLVFKPVPNAIVLATAVTGVALFLGAELGGAKKATQAALSGYASPTTWIIISAFALSIAFTKTGLGARIAYLLINALGKSTLRLGYVTSFLDLIISPATPSNTARAGGIVFPIINSIANNLNPNKSGEANRAGAYLACNTYMSTKVTSFIFATAQASNFLVISAINTHFNLGLDWGMWALALVVPGIICLLFVPIITYIFIRPDVKKIDNKAIASQGLAKLGKITNREIMLIVILIAALLGWSLPSILNAMGFKISINATAVALAAMCASVLTGVIKWEDIASSKEAISTLFWFGGIMSLSTLLKEHNFFIWLGALLEGTLTFKDHAFLAVVIIGLISIFIRYLFASATVYAVTIFPVFLLLAKAAGADVLTLCFVLAATNSFGGAITHYGGPAAPIIFGAGYNNVKEWWLTGTMVALISFVIILFVGGVWWKIVF